MIGMTLALEGDGAFDDLQGEPQRDIIHLGNDAPPIQVAVLDGGMTSGKPSIAIRIDLPDGRVLIAETSARLFCSAAKIISDRYPDLLDEDGSWRTLDLRRPVQ